MAYYNYPQRKNNSKFTGMGVGPHDYVTYTYDGSGNTELMNHLPPLRVSPCNGPPTRAPLKKQT